MSVEPWSPGTFEDRFRTDPDPWDLWGSPYEQGRYRAVLRALRKPRYRRAYEPACAVGALTARLADRCDQLVATDVSPTVLATARSRCGDRPSVHLAVGSVTDPPPAALDLIVLSEVGYYLEPDELAATADRLAEALGPTGELVACHWLGTSPDHRMHGSEVHEILGRRLGAQLERVGGCATPGFLLETWTRP